MQDIAGTGLVVFGCGLLVAAELKRRARMRPVTARGRIRPEFAVMGEIVRPLIYFALLFVALKMSVFYFFFDTAHLMSPLIFGGLLYVLAAYAVWLWVATKPPVTAPASRAIADPRAIPAGLPSGPGLRHATSADE